MEDKYFDKIPLWSETGKRFEVMADAISGRIPVTKVERWQDFSGLLESGFFNQNGTQWVFCGHRRNDWSLLPTLGRLTENGILGDELANQQLELFRRAVRGRLKWLGLRLYQRNLSGGNWWIIESCMVNSFSL